MKLRSGIVVAAAAGSAMGPNAQAADLPAKAPAKVAAEAWNWTGFYVGGHLGAAWQRAESSGTYLNASTPEPFTNSTSHTGFAGGGQIGYNWQSGMFVYGLEADATALTGSETASQRVTNPIMTSTNKIDWVGTVRGRLGAAIASSTLVYATGGFAYGRVKNTHTEVDGSLAAAWQDDSIRTGYAVGGGIEHMFAQHWTIRAEGLYVDLGDKTVSDFSGRCNNTCQPVTFNNKATIARGAINYKF